MLLPIIESEVAYYLESATSWKARSSSQPVSTQLRKDMLLAGTLTFKLHSFEVNLPDNRKSGQLPRGK